MSIKKTVFSDKKRKTYLRVLRSAIGATVGIVVLLIVLQLLGVNVSSMLAGVGIVSIVVGFALQDAMKDVFRGFEIIFNNYYNIGDYIQFGTNVGQVISISLRTTKIQDMNTMNIVSIANRNIDKVEIVSQYIYLTVPLPYEIKPDSADAIMAEVAEAIEKLDNVTSAEYQGLDAIASSVLNYQIAITCDPANKLTVNRAALGTVTRVLARHKLRLPYAHMDIREK